MRIKYKLPLYIIPLIIIPVIATGVIFFLNTSVDLESLNTDIMRMTMDVIIAKADEEHLILEQVGGAETEYYLGSVQTRLFDYVDNMESDGSFINVYDSKGNLLHSTIKGDEQDNFEGIEIIIQRSKENNRIFEFVNNETKKEYIGYFEAFDPWKWQIVIVADKEMIYSPLSKAMEQSTVIVMILAIALSFLLYVISRSITIPLDQLIKYSRLIGDGKFDVNIDVSRNDEFRELADAYNGMAKELSVNFDRLENEIHERRKSELDLMNSEKELNKLNSELEERVKERTLALETINRELAESLTETKETQKELMVTKDELEVSLKKLQDTQAILVESKKMAALGSLVVGISHEINTPVGVGITSSSYIELKMNELKKRFESNELTKSALDKSINDVIRSNDLILKSLNRASVLVERFKMISIDSSQQKIIQFEICECIRSVVHKLRPEIEAKKHTILFNCDGEIDVLGSPSAILQLIDIFVENSLNHGFKDILGGEIEIMIKHSDDRISLKYRDSGKGMAEKEVERIFEPFYTTQLGSGTSGLGMSIAYNLVTSVLDGEISIKSQPTMGTSIYIDFPVNRGVNYDDVNKA